jgi:TolB protein
MSRVLSLIMSICVICTVDLFAQGEIRGTIYSQGEFKALEISLMKFQTKHKWPQEESLASQISEVIQKDLPFSLFLEFLQENLFSFSDPADLSPLDQDIWLRTEAQFVLAGKLESHSRALKVDIFIYDAFARKKTYSQTYRAPESAWRRLAHEISNDVLFSLTGEKGIFNTRIAYIRETTSGKELYLCDFDGYDPQQITFDKTINLSPNWSPDGKKVCYTSYKSGNPDLWELQLETGKARKIASFKGINTAARYNPKSNQIALTLSLENDPEIYTINPGGSSPKRLTYSYGIESSPTWSPNGKQIAFTSDRTGSPQIYVMDADGSNVRRLTFGLSYCDSPAWSPNGDKIALVSREPGGFQIYTIDITGENLQRLTDQGNNENPSWSPDGYHLVYASSRAGRFEIYTMGWDGSNQTKITSGGGNFSPAWSNRF